MTHPLLSSFSTLILKLVDLLREIMSKGNVYEEEDFQPVVYDFNLCQVCIENFNFDDLTKDFFNDINECQNFFQSRLKSCLTHSRILANLSAQGPLKMSKMIYKSC